MTIAKVVAVVMVSAALCNAVCGAEFRLGVGAYEGRAAFRELRITNNDGKVVHSNDFATPDAARHLGAFFGVADLFFGTADHFFGVADLCVGKWVADLRVGHSPLRHLDGRLQRHRRGKSRGAGHYVVAGKGRQDYPHAPFAQRH